ncbi:MAG: hypothetical protein P1V35_16955 [Planctomycetota bacterium]|nr:hypothetical protein [Planctomycetota bacterium]
MERSEVPTPWIRALELLTEYAAKKVPLATTLTRLTRAHGKGKGNCKRKHAVPRGSPWLTLIYANWSSATK